MAHHRGVARDEYGNSISGATVTVYEAGTTTAATIYSDGTFDTSEDNPFTTGDDGVYEFYADPGLYDIQIAKAGFTTTTLENAIVGQVFCYASGASGGAYALATATAEDLTKDDGFDVTWTVHLGTDFSVDDALGIQWDGEVDVVMDIEVHLRATDATDATSTIQLSVAGTTDGSTPYSFTTEAIQVPTVTAGDVMNFIWRGVVNLSPGGTIKPILSHTEGTNETITIAQLLMFVRGIS